MKNKIAHIINPFIAPASSDLAIAQPITFESIRLAKEKAKDIIDVEVLAACYKEDAKLAPGFMKKSSFLQKSVLDEFNFEKKIKYPFIAEILEKEINESDAEFIIYSNIDIGLYRDFYIKVNELLNQGFDALIINRRRIESIYTKPSELEKIFTQEGKSHPGFDCFVFQRTLFKKMCFENICIGVPFFEISFSQNLFHLAKKYKIIQTNDFTFHMGIEIFKRRAPKEYLIYNRNEFRKLIIKLDPILKSKNLPYSNLFLPFRIVKWGLHPCIPIKLALRLEWRRWFK